MAAAPYNDKERDGRLIAFGRIYDRLSTSDQKIMARCARRLVDGMSREAAATLAYIERGWSAAEACEEAAKLVSKGSENPGRWQDSLD